MIEILVAIKRGVSNRKYFRGNLNRFKSILKNGLLDPFAMFRISIYIVQNKFPGLSGFRHFFKINTSSYLANLSFRDQVSIFIFHHTYIASKFNSVFFYPSDLISGIHGKAQNEGL